MDIISASSSSQTSTSVTHSASGVFPSATSSAFPSSVTSGSRALPPRAISGLVIGGMGLIIISLIIFCFCIKHRRRLAHPTVLLDDGSSDHAAVIQNRNIPPQADPISDTSANSSTVANLNSSTTFPMSHTTQLSTQFVSHPLDHSIGPTSDNPYSATSSSILSPDSNRYRRGARTILSALPSGLIVMSAGTGDMSGRSSPDDALPSSAALPSRDPIPINISVPPPQRPPQTKADLRRMQEIATHRQIRQADLQNQMRRIKQEMRELQAGSGNGASFYGGAGDDGDISDMREQIALMKAHIDRLQAHQSSEWAQGLSDEPPPDYSTPRPPVVR